MRSFLQNAMSRRRCLQHCGCHRTSATRRRHAPNSSRDRANRQNSGIRGRLPTLLPSARRRYRRNASCHLQSPRAHCSSVPRRCYQIRAPRRQPARWTTSHLWRRRRSLRATHQMIRRENLRRSRLHETNCFREILRPLRGSRLRCREIRHRRHVHRLRGHHHRRGRLRARMPRSVRTPMPRSPQMPSKFSRGWILSCQLPFPIAGGSAAQTSPQIRCPTIRRTSPSKPSHTRLDAAPMPICSSDRSLVTKVDSTACGQRG